MLGSLSINFKRVFIVAFILVLVSLAAGCGTSYDEWSGQMANEKPAQSVRGDEQRREAREKRDDAIILRPVLLTRASTRSADLAH